MSESPRSSSRGPIRAALLLGALAPAVFVPLDIIDALLRPGYSITRHWVSHLALGPLGWVGTVVLAITAVLCAIGAIGLLLALRRSGGKTAAALALLVAATALAVAAAFPMDPSLGFPTNVTPGEATLPGLVHQAAGPVFIVGGAIALMLAPRSLRSMGAPAHSALLQTFGVIAIAAFLLCTVLVSLDYANVWPAAPSGLAERVSIVVGLVGAAMVELTARGRTRGEDAL